MSLDPVVSPAGSSVRLVKREGTARWYKASHLFVYLSAILASTVCCCCLVHVVLYLSICLAPSGSLKLIIWRETCNRWNWKSVFRRLVFMFWSWIERVKKLSLQKSSTESQTEFVAWFSTNCKSESPGQISNPSSWRLSWRVPAQSNCNIPSQPNLSTKWSHRADFTGVATSCKQLRRLAPVLAAVANWVRSFA